MKVTVEYDDGDDSHDSVQFASEFTHWEPVGMALQRGTHMYRSPRQELEAGEYMYKFIVDGQWTLKDGVERVTDQSGIENHLLRVVGGEGGGNRHGGGGEAWGEHVQQHEHEQHPSGAAAAASLSETSLEGAAPDADAQHKTARRRNVAKETENGRSGGEMGQSHVVASNNDDDDDDDNVSVSSSKSLVSEDSGNNNKSPPTRVWNWLKRLFQKIKSWFVRAA